MWEWFHEKRQREPDWHYRDAFMTSDGLLNTDDGTMDGSYLEIGYDIGNYVWDPVTAERSGSLQKWLQHCPGVGHGGDGDVSSGLPWVANKFSGGFNDAKPIALTVGGGGDFKSFSHLRAVIEGFINHGIPLVVAVENGGHFNTLIGYWNIGSTFYIYTAEPLDGWGRPFYNKPMRWRRMLLNADMLATGTGTLVGMMPYGHAVQAGVGADWARQIDEAYKSNLLCGYLR